MRILFVSSQYPPYELGGYEQLCYEVTNDLMARGHDVLVLTSRYGLKNDQVTCSENVIRSLHLTADIHYYRPLDFFLKFPSQENANLAELKKIIDQFNPDVIMFWGMFAMSHSLPYWAEKWLPGRVTYYIASYWPTDDDLHLAYWRSSANRWVTEQFKRLLRIFAISRLEQLKYPPQLQFEHVLCCSEYVRDMMVDAGKFPPSASVVYAGATPEPFQRQVPEVKTFVDKKIRLLYFGRLVHDKGVHTAVEAVGLLAKQGYAERVELTILGDGHPDYKNLLHSKVRELNIEHNVQFLNKVSRDDVPDILKRFDIFLFTSIWPEPFGRTIIEAMMAGLIVIGSNVGGSREIFQHYDKDMLFEPGDAQGLANRIVRVISDPAIGHRLIESGRRLAFEHFTIRQMTNGIEKFLQDVLAHSLSMGNIQ